MGNDSTNKHSNKNQNFYVFKKPYPLQCERIAQFEFINSTIDNINVYCLREPSQLLSFNFLFFFSLGGCAWE